MGPWKKKKKISQVLQDTYKNDIHYASQHQTAWLFIECLANIDTDQVERDTLQ